MFTSDENASISIWLNVKLASLNYCIFDINLSVYNNVKKQFAISFQSPTQVSIMRMSRSFCLDATHCISSRNDETAVPIYHWFHHLCNKSSFAPMNITIDCSIPEQHNLDSKIKLNASFTSEQLGNYKIALKNYLRQILIESDKETFLKAINNFK
ncbi:hypothetical protein PHYBLDRAFT_161788 [Phycomyces blakesleeanus NRRL 1555(-)]|uniref:Uncharacterized protein n=1 Tax=Phycomyces blakesleeanus (strain ATCC 8743b / DSM 1359 / FGSC 10004 / NBRC 33097 / NRRL 1555) TaxID=763407 RepID=A0A167R9C1_PHYB8|nr:hypothetical protein PHYBLDRAFT_161788 [Phycomyces blakesleeanus NRRL 1555(-)]OAD81157.1 hypothetical protein PHYBLDRAFT_161788 [Phycomyces blakesleeanus NRRL 1555(-)]|eukprot:XP_018299197.1 hypothetical protein PHYBLDRAFT_161788 [Phycomyces blakesleeanus NRRL 1555(-)]